MDTQPPSEGKKDLTPFISAGKLTPEDWRILRALSLYRLLMVTVLLLLQQGGWLAVIFDPFRPVLFYSVCVAYAIVALLLLLPIVYRRPHVELQAHAQFFFDTAGITTLAYACGGVPSGLSMLLLTTAVACSMVISTRMALLQAAGVTLAMFAEEIYRLYPIYDTGPITQAGILGLMFFATSAAANAVAQRARKSEALAAQAGSDLASLAQLNESVIEHMDTGVAVIEPGGGIRLLNAAAARMLGAYAGQALADCSPALATALADWRQDPGAPESPLAPRPGAEEVVPRFSRLGWAPDAPALVLLDSARSLREQALQMNLAALGRLSAGIAHEIRNPLSAISHAGQLLAESPDLGPENQRLLSMIQRHSERIDKIIKDVLALSRREGTTPGPIPLRSWLGQAVAQYREGYPGQDRAIRYDRVEAEFTTRFDASHLQQVLFNLWDNSFLHGGADGRRVEIELATGTGPGGGFLEVRDNGPGIPADLRDRVFEPFFSTAHAGTGLGLYLARELCAYNRARLTYRESPDGACFRLAFTESVKAAAA
jgi:two-component system sensor histidine kinase PilS (NtrC family)